MSDRTTLFGLAFGAFVLTGATLGFFAYELGRDRQAPHHMPQHERMAPNSASGATN